MNKKHILDEIKRIANEEGGKPPGRERFSRLTGIKPSDWAGIFWVNWSEAVREAGFSPNIMNKAYTDDYLLEKLVELIKELNHFPVWNELRLQKRKDNAFPSHSVYARLGSMNNIAKNTIEYCHSNSIDVQIIEICQKKIADGVTDESTAKISENVEYSFVYLMKLGKDYKIGWSNNPERREYDIGLKMPRKPKLLHKIKTDDPIGIEKYWHERFKDKNIRAEWFNLDQNDIQIFKRRSFM